LGWPRKDRQFIFIPSDKGLAGHVPILQNPLVTQITTPQDYCTRSRAVDLYTKS